MLKVLVFVEWFLFVYCPANLLLHDNLPQKFHFAHSLVDQGWGRAWLNHPSLILIVFAGAIGTEGPIPKMGFSLHVSLLGTPWFLSPVPQGLLHSVSFSHLKFSGHSDFWVITFLTSYLAFKSKWSQTWKLQDSCWPNHRNFKVSFLIDFICQASC